MRSIAPARAAWPRLAVITVAALLWALLLLVLVLPLLVAGACLHLAGVWVVALGYWIKGKLADVGDIMEGWRNE